MFIQQDILVGSYGDLPRLDNYVTHPDIDSDTPVWYVAKAADPIAGTANYYFQIVFDKPISSSFVDDIVDGVEFSNDGTTWYKSSLRYQLNTYDLYLGCPDITTITPGTTLWRVTDAFAPLRFTDGTHVRTPASGTVIGTLAQTVDNVAGSKNWTCPTGVTWAIVECIGAGGGGRAATSASFTARGGGGGGGYAKSVITGLAGDGSTTYPYVVGAKGLKQTGAGGSPANQTPTAGGLSSFGSGPSMYAAGGGIPNTFGGAGSGGTSNSGAITYSGASGGTTSTNTAFGGGGGGQAGLSSGAGTAGSAGTNGALGAGGGTTGAAGSGGDGGAPTGTTARNGVSGTAPGGGGGGAAGGGTNANTGGDGADGQVTITCYPYLPGIGWDLGTWDGTFVFDQGLI